MENDTEFIRCEHCKQVFDHDSTDPRSMRCPYCSGVITDASETIAEGSAEWLALTSYEADLKAQVAEEFNGVD